MGSYTEKLGLYKADPITDGDDTFNIDKMLNENWEKLDDITAEQVGAAISKDLASEKDLNNFVIGGIYRLGEGLLNGPNEHRSDYGQLLVINGGNSDTICQILCTMSFTDGTLHYRSKFGEEAWSSWQELANAANFLPLDGSAAMTGDINIKNRAILHADKNELYLRLFHETDDIYNYRQIGLGTKHRSDYKELEKSFKLWVVENGKQTPYNIFGEHNTSLLATTIQNLIQGGSISMIKSIQRGIITIAANATEGTATLAQAVNMSKAVVLFGGTIDGGDNYGYNTSSWDARLVLSANNKVNAARAYSPDYTAIVPYQVLEFA